MWSQFLNTAILRESTHVSAHSHLLASGRSFGLSGTMSGSAAVPWNRSLYFVLPSHSDIRASHVLLPVWTFYVAAVLHWMSLKLACGLLGDLFGPLLAGFISGPLQGDRAEIPLLVRLIKKKKKATMTNHSYSSVFSFVFLLSASREHRKINRKS